MRFLAGERSLRALILTMIPRYDVTTLRWSNPGWRVWQLVELIRAKKQWAPAIFSTSNFTWHKYSLGWSEEKSAWRHTVSMQISLNLHNLCKNTKYS